MLTRTDLALFNVDVCSGLVYLTEKRGKIKIKTKVTLVNVSHLSHDGNDPERLGTVHELGVASPFPGVFQLQPSSSIGQLESTNSRQKKG